jgi:hypothetical protein
MKWFPVLSVGQVLSLWFEVAMRDNRVAAAHPGVPKDTGGRQLRAIPEKSWIGEEAALTMPILMDLRSTEDHGYHLSE